MNKNQNNKSLARFNFTYNFKTKSFELPKRIRLPDCPLPSSALDDLISTLEITDIKSNTGISIQ